MSNTQKMERGISMDAVTSGQIIALILEFHTQTGVSVDDILIFYKKLSSINTEFAVRVMKEEIRKM